MSEAPTVLIAGVVALNPSADCTVVCATSVIPGGGPVPDTVKVSALLTCPFTVTVTPPDVAVAGTVQVIDVLDHALTAAVTPLNLTEELPCADSK